MTDPKKRLSLVETVCGHITGAQLDDNTMQLAMEKFNPTKDREFAAVANYLKMKGKGDGTQPDDIVRDVYDKFLNAKHSEGESKQFMNMLMTFASKGYAPKLDHNQKIKLKKFLSSGMQLEEADLMLKEADMTIDDVQLDAFTEHIMKLHGG